MFSQTLENYINEGDEKTRSGHYKEAISDYSLVLEIDPNNAWAYSSRGFCWNKLERYILAIEDFTIAIKLEEDPKKKGYAYQNRGQSKILMENYEEAILDYNKALELNGKDAISYYERGICNFNLGRQKLGLIDVNKAIALNDGYSYWYVERARIKEVLGDYEGALEDLERALELGAGDNAILGMGVMKERLGNYSGAIEDYNNLILRYPKIGAAYYRRGISNWAIGNFEEACNDCLKAIRLGVVETSEKLKLKCDSIASFASKSDKKDNYSSSDVVSHINGLLYETSSTITYENNILTCWNCSPNSKWQKVDIRKIIDVEVDQGVVLINGPEYSIQGLYGNLEIPVSKLIIESKMYFDAEKVANALRYLVNKSKSPNSLYDPFTSYNKSAKTKYQVKDLNLGLSVKQVSELLDKKIVLESKESGYQVYRVEDEGGQYFLYFEAGILTRVDKGEYPYDAVIIMQHN